MGPIVKEGPGEFNLASWAAAGWRLVAYLKGLRPEELG